jgi:hypothetical protein
MGVPIYELKKLTEGNIASPAIISAALPVK